MMQISQRANSIAASQSLAMAARAKKMRAEGIDVISMSLGEPDMDTPEHIRRAAQEAIDNHWSHYGPVPGIPSLREAIATSQNQLSIVQRPTTNDQRQIVFHPEDVLVSIGAKMAIYNAIQTLINPGDEVIIPLPSWVSYTEMVKLAEGKVVPVQTTYEDNYLLTPGQLRAALTERTRMLILCSPNNPTGSIYSRAQLQALIDVLRDFPNVTILSDEIYRCLTYGCEAPGLASFPELQDRLVIVNGVSKAYAMTGYRIGWLLSKNRDFLSACTRLQGQQLTCATMVAQKAAEAALTGPQDCVADMRQTFAERRELICRLASEVPGFRFREPQGAFYLFPDVSAIGSGDEVAERLLDEAHVAVVSGSAFGCPECIRLSYAISTEEIEEAMRRIKTALS
ncbi:MAG: pyridoxal phosphate-dependent aminotransferase [Paludibacteraceae bacterium]|nr:pyridoxal phosphate-dependent aminotransferase [Paludibacteraceae bacterium]